MKIINDMNVPSVKAPATVTSAGEKLQRLIKGVVIRKALTVEDERGEVSEIYSDAWQISDSPLCYAYMSTVRSGQAKGWVYHKTQEDRIATISGFAKYILWDPRTDSPTYNLINEIFVSERNRALLIIPPLVIHGVQNIGTTDIYFINLPTVPYNHADPDKYRVDPEHVPYDLTSKIGR